MENVKENKMEKRLNPLSFRPQNKDMLKKIEVAIAKSGKSKSDFIREAVENKINPEKVEVAEQQIKQSVQEPQTEVATPGEMGNKPHSTQSEFISTPQTQPQTQPPVQQQPTQPPPHNQFQTQQPQPPLQPTYAPQPQTRYIDPMSLPPHEFLKVFLEEYGIANKAYIMAACAEVQQTGQLPDSVLLYHDLSYGKGGGIGSVSALKISRVYEKRLQQYMASRQVQDAQFRDRAFRTGQSIQPTGGTDYRARQMQAEISDLKAEIKKRDQEDERNFRNEVLTNQQKTNQRFDGWDANFANRVKEVVLTAKKPLDEATVQEMINRAGASTGMVGGHPQAAVDMKKNEFDYLLENKKIEKEGKKLEEWGQLLSTVGDVVGEGIGRGLSAQGAPPQQQPGGIPGFPGVPTQATPPSTQLTDQANCPFCEAKLMLPANVAVDSDFTCGRCGATLGINSDGYLVLLKNGMTPTAQKQKLTSPVEPDFKPTPPKDAIREPPVRKTPPPEEQQIQTGTEESLGDCPICKSPVYDSNIGKTEQGRPYHKECVKKEAKQ